jgi:Ca2+-binding EF-hand superfamily protein
MEMMAQFPIIKALDTDGDGSISAAEMQAAPTTLASLDSNSDGVLDASEIMPRRGRRGGDGKRGQGGDRGGDGFVERMMENDANGDGQISLDEAPERMQNFFNRLDGDGDGVLTRSELTEAGQRGGKRRKGGKGAEGKGGKRGPDGAGQRPRRPASE